jgi:hypothetical protein
MGSHNYSRVRVEWLNGTWNVLPKNWLRQVTALELLALAGEEE